MLLTMFDHGLMSSSASDMNSDLISLCGAKKTEYNEMSCIAHGHALTDYAEKKNYTDLVAKGLVRCPYKTCVVSTPGFPVVAPGYNTPAT